MSKSKYFAAIFWYVPFARIATIASFSRFFIASSPLRTPIATP